MRTTRSMRAEPAGARLRPARRRHRTSPPIPCPWALGLAVGLIAGPAFAQNGANRSDDGGSNALTVQDPNVPIEQLEWRLKPLTREQLETEAKAWRGLVQDKVAEIAAAEIRVLERNRRITRLDAQAAEQQDEAARAPTTQAAENARQEKQETLERLTALREQRTALINRLNTVLAELTAKGGDAEPYERYVTAVSGIKVDVSDASAAWVAIRGWLTSREGGLRWARNITLFIVTLIVFLVLARIAGKATEKAVAITKQTSALLKDFMVKGVRRTVLFVGFVVALSMLGVPIGPFLAVIGAAGLVVGLALQGTLSNFASGILILLYRPYDVGDAIEAGGISGKVVGMNLVSTNVLTFDNKKMVVPNNRIWGDVITNITGSETRRIDMTFGISYSDDIDKAQRILEEIITGHALVLKDPEPMVKLHELADSSVNFIVRPWCKTGDYWTIYWDVTRTVKQRFDAEGISIPFPQRDVHLYSVSGDKG